MSVDSSIKLTIDGVEVEGVVTHRSAADIGITICRPYQNLSTGSHIMAILRGHLSFDGARGDRRLRECLEDLYRLGQFLDANMQTLSETLSVATDKIDALHAEMMNPERFKQEKARLKARLKGGEIDNLEHQRRRQVLSKENARFETALWEIKDAFFEENFPRSACCGYSEEVVDILQGKKTLLAPRQDR